MEKDRLEIMKEIREKCVGGGHLAVATLDIEKSIEFYTQILGFKISYECVVQGTRLVFVEMDNMSIELIAFTDPEQVACGFTYNEWNHQNGVFMHICLLADADRAGLEAMIKNFEALGVKILEGVRWNPTVKGVKSQGSYCFFIEGPNGEQIEYNT